VIGASPFAPTFVAMSENKLVDKRVLIIDDLPDIRFLLRTYLERDGFDVVGEAADPDAGHALAVAHRPDGVIIDVRMPGFDAMAAMARLRAALPDVRILAVSAAPADVDLGGLAHAAVADAFFDKAAGFDNLVRQFSALFTGTMNS
jgi:DNA-binding NarL/FixJ family response regulator